MTLLDPLDDFRNVLYLVFKQILGREPTPMQYEIAHWMQHGPRRQVTEAFRGEGKSWIASAYACDELRKDPSKNIMAVSAAKQRADDFTTFCLRLIHEVPIFQHLQPRADQRNSKLSFDVGPAPAAHAPSLKSVGVLGQMTGSRADIILADDVESWNNSATALMRDKLSETIKEFDAILKPNGRVLFLGTPQTEQSIYMALGQRGYETRVWPARYPSREQITVYGSNLAPSIRDAVEKSPELEGKSTDPLRFNDLDLAEREMSYGRSGFALQFMLDTRLSDVLRYPLRLADLMVMDLDVDVCPERLVWARSPELEMRDLENVGFNGDRYYRPLRIEGVMVPYTGSVLAIDPSGKGADELGYAVVKARNSTLFVPVASGIQGGYERSTLEFLAETAKAQKVNRVLVEENFGGGMFAELLKPVLNRIYPCPVEEVRHSIQKEKRIIDTLEPVMNSHRLVFGTSVIEKDSHADNNHSHEQALRYRLMYQLTRITRERGALAHDDRLDALAIGVAHFAERMNLSVDDEMKKRQADFEDENLRKFMEHATGQRQPEETWLSKGIRHLRGGGK